MLYHYCSTEGFFNILTSHCIWLSENSCTNDRYEMRMLDGVFYKALSNLTERVGLVQEQEKQAIACYEGSKMFNFLGCFSKESNILSQWRNYADDANGFVIGFDEKLFCADSNYRLSLDRINPTGDVDQFFLHDVTYLEKKESRDLVNQAEEWILKRQNNDFFEHIFFGKHASFREEKEVRLLWLPELNGNIESVIFKKKNNDFLSKIHFRTSRDKIIPYVEFPFSKESVREIIIGPKNKMNPDTVALKMFLLNNGYNLFNKKQDAKGVVITRFDIPYV